MILAIIQARLTSTRLPGKVLMKIAGKSMIARVCEATRTSMFLDKVVVAWAHKYPTLDENDVLGRFRLIVNKYKPEMVVRLTSDCPLLTGVWIDNAICEYVAKNTSYFSNHVDGYDVQVFHPSLLWSVFANKEHVLGDFTTPSKGLSVNTLEDLKRVEGLLCTTK